mmetsp:Transcript_23033/g.54421  ORF Transcript_23033/g.54421 Transcript_23033/m.54421 type:complete len:262 (+) Transcript_23033:463-1248(+)
MGRQVCGDSRGNDVIGSSDQDTHTEKHHEKNNRIHFILARKLGKDSQENYQKPHEGTNDKRTTSAEKVRYVSNNDSTGHQSDRVKRSDKIGSDRFECLSQEIWKPEKQAIVDKFAETKHHGIIGCHGNLKGTGNRNSLRSRVFFDAHSFLCHLLFLCFEFRSSELDFGGNNSCFERIRNELHCDESEKDIGYSGNEKCPPVGPVVSQNPSGDQSRSYITGVLVTGPETEDQATVGDRFFVTKPISHHSSSNGTSSGLKDSE